MTVVDASVLFDALRGGTGDAASALVAAVPPLNAPELLDLEVAAVTRRLTAAGKLREVEAATILQRLAEAPVRRHGHADLVGRAWQLRATLTVYDAAYVALAERLGATLLTADRRLATAPGLRCPVEVVRAA